MGVQPGPLLSWCPAAWTPPISRSRLRPLHLPPLQTRVGSLALAQCVVGIRPFADRRGRHSWGAKQGRDGGRPERGQGRCLSRGRQEQGRIVSQGSAACQGLREPGLAGPGPELGRGFWRGAPCPLPRTLGQGLCWALCSAQVAPPSPHRPGLQRRRLIPAPLPDTVALGHKPGQWVDLPPPLAGSRKEPFEIKVYEIDDVERLQGHRPPPREDAAEVRGGQGTGGPGIAGWPLGVWPGSVPTSPLPLVHSSPRTWRR